MIWNVSSLLGMTKSNIQMLDKIKIESISTMTNFALNNEIVVSQEDLKGKGRIEVGGIPCVAYIKNDASGNQKWHFYKCSTITSHDSFGGRYVVKTDSEGNFVLEGGRQKPLEPCRKCLAISSKSMGYDYEFWESLGDSPKDSNSAFIPMVSDATLFSDASGCWTKTSKLLEHELSGYVRDWPRISYLYRKSKMWKCEVCSLDLSSKRMLLHTHHVNRDKKNNDYSNFLSLCVRCHSDQPFHDHMKLNNKFAYQIEECKLMLGEQQK